MVISPAAAAHVRRIAMLGCRDGTQLTLQAIGDLFGGIH